eukprot:m.184783 g.184783  ORF g.184783 m.184783 type:complete len:70 (+) comp32207_c5_seq1:1043-1252(+)
MTASRSRHTSDFEKHFATSTPLDFVREFIQQRRQRTPILTIIAKVSHSSSPTHLLVAGEFVVRVPGDYE